jgi:hypothetical protein
MKLGQKVILSSILVSTAFAPLPSFASEGSSAVVLQAAAAHRPLPAAASFGIRSDEDRYVSREAASPGAKIYRGGDVMVISVTAVALVLLVVLLNILI